MAVSSSIYYRRWTRMHFYPAIKHFHKWNVLDAKMDMFKPIIATNAFEEGFVKWAPKWKGKNPDLDKRLLDKLFLKYPDLKYEKLQMDRAAKNLREDQNMFSYAYKFIRKQKIYMNQGFHESKAFEMVEKEFHSRMARKLDQTLLARGLAIGNKARSLLTTYQQQMEYESRLKMMRTQREVQKYQQKIKDIKDKVELNPEEEYRRILFSVQGNEVGESFADLLGLEQKDQQEISRAAFVSEFNDGVSNMFKTYYKRAASKDKLDGLTDSEIQGQIMLGPTKIRRKLNELLRITKKYNVTLDSNGQLNLDDVMNPRIKHLLADNPNIKIALMLRDLDYEQPHRMELRKELRDRKSKLDNQGDDLTTQEKETILKNKKVVYSRIQPYDLRETAQTYKAFETYEERLMRIEIKWLQSKINQLYNQGNPLDEDAVKEKAERLKEMVERFRRLKFKIDQKIKLLAEGEIQEMFQEHQVLDDDGVDLGKKVEFEAMFHYLKSKNDDRRLTPLDASIDDKINSLITNVPMDQDPKPEGWKDRIDE